MDRVCGDVRFTSDDPGDWPDIEAVLPRRLWPAQVWAGSKWAGKERPTYPAIDAAIAAALAGALSLSRDWRRLSRQHSYRKEKDIGRQ